MAQAFCLGLRHVSFRMRINDILRRSISTLNPKYTSRHFEEWSEGLRGKIEDAEKMQQQGAVLSRDEAYHMLHECTRLQDVDNARRVQSLMIHSALDSVSALADQLIRLFASWGNLDEATKVFYKVLKPTHHTWAAIIKAHVKFGEGEKAIELYDLMLQSGIKSDKYIFVGVLQACIIALDIKKGSIIHDQIIKAGLHLDKYVGSVLVDMYSKWGDLHTAWEVFDGLPNQNVVSWGALIGGYAQHGKGLLALQLYEKMQNDGVMPDMVIFVSILQACASIDFAEYGRYIHVQIMENGLQSVSIVGNTLVDMYAKCRNLGEAQKAFDMLTDQNVVSWGALIAGYSQHSEAHQALECFDIMQHQGVKADKLTFLSILRACGSIEATHQGRNIHEKIIERGLQCDADMVNMLIDMYFKCGSLQEARETFDNLKSRSARSWDVIIAGYSQHGNGILALECFDNMKQMGIHPGRYTLLSILKACDGEDAITHGRYIHNQILHCGFQCDVIVCGALTDMYMNCGSLEEAYDIFNKLPKGNVVSWGAMIEGYTQNGEGLLALECFDKMKYEGMIPNKAVLLSTLKACGRLGDSVQARRIHEQIIESGVQLDIVVGSSIIDMYVKCGNLEDAWEVFCGLPNRNVVSWGTMIGGYAQSDGLIAIELFHVMHQEGINPDKGIYIGILKACGYAGGILQGKQIHKQIMESSFKYDVLLGSAIIDMYSNCGDMDQAHKVFDELSSQDIVSWSTIIGGYAQMGNASLAIQGFENMQQNGMKPDEKTFTGILSACSHAGLVDEGLQYFKLMTSSYGIIANMFHCACMVDLLGHGGYFREAAYFLQAIQDNVCGWIALLDACKMHGNIMMATQCLSRLVHLDSSHSAGYVLMSNICASVYVEDEN